PSDGDGGGGSGVRLLVANDDTALLSLALAEMAAACADLSRSVARLSARCADPLLRQFDAPFAALVRGGLADLHRLQYSGARKWTGRCGICSGSWRFHGAPVPGARRARRALAGGLGGGGGAVQIRHRTEGHGRRRRGCQEEG
ncbi:Os11g0238400, partial [Oryza sativa Japonica Group]